MRRCSTPLEHVEPPGIVSEVNADMVGHEIQDQPDVMLFQRGAHAFKRLFAPEFGIEQVVFDNVVAVGAALASFQKW